MRLLLHLAPLTKHIIGWPVALWSIWIAQPRVSFCPILLLHRTIIWLFQHLRLSWVPWLRWLVHPRKHSKRLLGWLCQLLRSLLSHLVNITLWPRLCWMSRRLLLAPSSLQSWLCQGSSLQETAGSFQLLQAATLLKVQEMIGSADQVLIGHRDLSCDPVPFWGQTLVSSCSSGRGHYDTGIWRDRFIFLSSIFRILFPLTTFLLHLIVSWVVIWGEQCFSVCCTGSSPFSFHGSPPPYTHTHTSSELWHDWDPGFPSGLYRTA